MYSICYPTPSSEPKSAYLLCACNGIAFTEAKQVFFPFFFPQPFFPLNKVRNCRRKLTLKALNKSSEMGIGAISAFWLWGFLIGFGSGPKTAMIAGIAVWVPWLRRTPDGENLRLTMVQPSLTVYGLDLTSRRRAR